MPPLKLGTSNPWPDASDDDSEEDSDDEPLDAPVGIRGRSASESSPPAPRGTRIAVVATKVTDEDEDVAERGATAAVRLVSCAANAAKSPPAIRRNPWQSEAISGSSEASSGSVRVHLELSLCRQTAAEEPNVATDSTGISSGVRVALRLVTMSAVPSVVRYTFPYAAPLGMYLAQRDGFFIVETVIPSMQAAEAGVVPGAVVLSMHRRSGEDAIWMDLEGMRRDEIIAEIEQVPRPFSLTMRPPASTHVPTAADATWWAVGSRCPRRRRDLRRNLRQCQCWSPERRRRRRWGRQRRRRRRR